MFFIIISSLALLGHLSWATPLDSPTSDLSQYFDSRIVGGNLAPQESSTHMVALIIGGQFTSFVCGGSIITQNHFMTAAHCIAAFVDWHGNLLSTLHGRVGSMAWNQGGIIVKFETYKNHDDYNHHTLKNDIGLLTLTKALKFTPTIRAIALHKDDIDGGVSCYVTGWGTERLWGNVPEFLNILYVKTMYKDHCEQLMSDIAASLWPPPPLDHTLELCTFHSHGHGMCHGDSGSAVVCYGEQVGLVSWGFPCAIGAPDVHVRVKPFHGFIEENTGKKIL